MIKRILTCAITASVCVSAFAEEQTPVQVLRFPHAGIELSLPSEFERKVLVEPPDVVRAIASRPENSVIAVTLAAMPFKDPEVTAEKLAEVILEQQKKNLAVRRLEVLKSTTMPLAGQIAQARLLSYLFRGNEMVAARVFFIRPAESSDYQLAFCLTVETGSSHKNELLPILGAIVKTIGFLPIRHPADMPAGDLGPAINDARQGVSLQVPNDWYMMDTNAGLMAAHSDFLLGGSPTRQIRVVVRPLEQDQTVESFINQCIQLATDPSQAKQYVSEILSRGPGKLGSMEGYQFLVRQVRSPSTEADSTQAPQQADKPSLLIIQRSALTPQGQIISLILLQHNGDTQAALDLMEVVAKTVELQKAPPQAEESAGGESDAQDRGDLAEQGD